MGGDVATASLLEVWIDEAERKEHLPLNHFVGCRRINARRRGGANR
jgi:hypothetical protein